MRSLFLSPAAPAAAALALLSLAVARPAAAQNIVTNGDFESPTVLSGFGFDSFAGGSSFTGWDVEGAGVVLVGGFWQPASGSQSVELNLFAAGGIAQNLTTVPGQSYLLSFEMAGQPGIGPAIKEIQVFWDDSLSGTFTFDTTGKALNDMGWVNQQLTLTATGTTTSLRFVGSVPDTGDGGPGLDDVRVTAIAAAAPEPGTLLLTASLLLPLAGGALRRRYARSG